MEIVNLTSYYKESVKKEMTVSWAFGSRRKNKKLCHNFGEESLRIFHCLFDRSVRDGNLTIRCFSGLY
jgi:hypothetical protein